MRDLDPILPESGGKVEVANSGNAIALNVTGPLSPGATGVMLDRPEAEAVAKALYMALASLRIREAMPASAEPLEGALDRKRRK